MKYFRTLIFCCSVALVSCQGTLGEEGQSVYGTVYAAGTNGAVMNDGSSFVYIDKPNHNLAAGDNVQITGVLHEKEGISYFDSKAKISKEGTSSVTYEEARYMSTAKVMGWRSNPSIMFGKLRSGLKVSESGNAYYDGLNWDRDYYKEKFTISIDARPALLEVIKQNQNDTLTLTGFLCFKDSEKDFRFIVTSGTTDRNKPLEPEQDNPGGGGNGNTGTGSTPVWGQTMATISASGVGVRYSSYAQYCNGKTCYIDYVYYPDSQSYTAYGGPYSSNPDANGGKGVAFSAHSGYNSERIYADYAYDDNGRPQMYYLYINFTLP